MADFVKNIEIGPGETYFDEVYLGRTTGETQFSYSIETEEMTTEEDGVFDELVTGQPTSITVPMFETDVDNLAKVIPWAEKDGDTLHIGSVIGKRLQQYAKKVEIKPAYGGKDIVLHKAYPKPGPIEFTFSRTGQRVANITFIPLRDTTQPEGKDFFDLIEVETQVANVYANPGSGDYDTAQDVVLSCATADSTIYYTLDGSTPTEASTEYTTAITVDSAQVITAYAVHATLADSEVSEFYYVGDLTI